jgi:hypothetical protein
VQQHYIVGRGTKGNSLDMSQPFNPYDLPAYDMRNSTTMELFKSYVDQANDSTTVTLFYHKVSDGSDDYSVALEDFAAQMQYLYDSNFEVQTLKQLFTSTESSGMSSWFILNTNTVSLNSNNQKFYAEEARLIL